MAITALTGANKISINFSASEALDLQTARADLNPTSGMSYSYTFGDGASQANNLWSDQRTLSDGASEELDLNDGSLVNGIGDAISFDAIKAMYIKNHSTDAILVVGAALTDEWTTWLGGPGDKVLVQPGGRLFVEAPDATGYALASSNAHLKLAHNGDGSLDLTYDIILIGVSS